MAATLLQRRPDPSQRPRDNDPKEPPPRRRPRRTKKIPRYTWSSPRGVLWVRILALGFGVGLVGLWLASFIGGNHNNHNRSGFALRHSHDADPRHHHHASSISAAWMRDSNKEEAPPQQHNQHLGGGRHHALQGQRPPNPPVPISPLKRQYEATHDPRNTTRIQAAVDALRVPNPTLKPCPPVPQEPPTWPLLDILHDWNPNDVNLPSPISFQGLCALDWQRDSYETIQAYRRAEIPFVLQNHPTVMATTERWNTPLTSSTDQTKTEPYLVELLRNEPPQRNEYAKQSNHMPFWRILNPDEVDPHFVPPTQNVALTLPEWWQHAQHLEEALAHNQTTVTTSDHYYFRLAATLTHGPEPVHAFLYDELPIFHPSYQETGDLDPEEDASTTQHHDPLFMVDPSQERGINCRFGMVGNVADNHFDPTRNWIVVLGGRRRYILSPPSQCRHLNLHPLGHVSARHSADDWSQTSTSKAAQDHLQHAQALQIVLQPGDALYLPTSWFHFIVSLTTSFQCNARSGSTQTRGSKLQAIFEECGFPNLYV